MELKIALHSPSREMECSIATPDTRVTEEVVIFCCAAKMVCVSPWLHHPQVGLGLYRAG